MTWIDISLALDRTCPCWPGDEPFRTRRTASMDRGDPCTVTAIAGSAHLGTHVDAPSHYVPGGGAIDALPLQTFVGDAVVVEILSAGNITADALDDAAGDWPERLLLRTANSAPGGGLDRGDPAGGNELTVEAAERAMDGGVRLIGIDGLSIGSDDVHRALLSRGIAILEGADLRRARPGPYTLVALPLKLVSLEASPVRAVLIPRPTAGCGRSEVFHA